MVMEGLWVTCWDQINFALLIESCKEEPLQSSGVGWMAMLDLGLFICHSHQHLTQAFPGAHSGEEKRKQELDSRGGQCARAHPHLHIPGFIFPPRSARVSLRAVWGGQEHPTVYWCFRVRAQVSEISSVIHPQQAIEKTK